MDDLIYRAMPIELELRGAGSQRILAGRLVPYGITQDISPDLREEFVPGAFADWTRSAHRVVLRQEHQNVPGSIVGGYGRSLEERPDGLYGEMKVLANANGDGVLELVGAGTLRQWSIGFRALRSRKQDGVVFRERASLFEVALVFEGAYGALAEVSSVRSRYEPAERTLRRDELLKRMPPAYVRR